MKVWSGLGNIIIAPDVRDHVDESRRAVRPVLSLAQRSDMCVRGRWQPRLKNATTTL